MLCIQLSRHNKCAMLKRYYNIFKDNIWQYCKIASSGVLATLGVTWNHNNLKTQWGKKKGIRKLISLHIPLMSQSEMDKDGPARELFFPFGRQDIFLRLQSEIKSFIVNSWNCVCYTWQCPVVYKTQCEQWVHTLGDNYTRSLWSMRAGQGMMVYFGG